MPTKNSKSTNDSAIKVIEGNDSGCKLKKSCMREVIGSILITSLIIFGWLYVFGGPESQSYGMSRTNRWLKEHQIEWQKLQCKYSGLKDVKMSAYTGHNGALAVTVPRVISAKDELILYRFLMKYKVNRPIVIFR
ncbi:MAG: hypothetical protein GY750_20690 [Lentisphaerae bacterium]|nr:hypothetical protein [Lentisphaerota bacterium]MCP4103809.1 hypothetical protein [Lentisphaerota bacterium]